ncbi:MAG: 2-keto-4-pentenoate hydratase [Acidimicrobiales bacterium]
MISDRARRDAARALAVAGRDRAPIAPLSAVYPELDVEDAYAIQRLLIAARLDQGAMVRGHKVGLTSKAMQEQLGVGEPDYGHILEDMVRPDGDTITVDELCSPRAEPEIAFVLRSALRGPGVSVADVLDATRCVLPALEIIDSRIGDWRVTLADTIADNASSGLVVLGDRSRPPRSIDRTSIPVVVRCDGSVVAEGTSGAVLGDPAAAIAWLANTLSRHDIALEPGHLVMSGSCTAAFAITAGTEVAADFGGLGTVTARFA